MATKHCPECGHWFADVITCPECGHTLSSPLKLIVTLAVIAMVGAAVVALQILANPK